MANVLMCLSGSIWLSNSWKQELVITEDGVEGEVIQGLKRIKMHLPYDRIAQVNLLRGVFRADLEVVNKGGTGNLIVKALNKGEAEEAKNLIEAKIQSALHAQSVAGRAPQSVADELRKLAELRDQGLITEVELHAQKAKLLA
jgi:Short C-terminal domain